MHIGFLLRDDTQRTLTWRRHLKYADWEMLPRRTSPKPTSLLLRNTAWSVLPTRGRPKHAVHKLLPEARRPLVGRSHPKCTSWDTAWSTPARRHNPREAVSILLALACYMPCPPLAWLDTACPMPWQLQYINSLADHGMGWALMATIHQWIWWACISYALSIPTHTSHCMNLMLIIPSL